MGGALHQLMLTRAVAAPLPHPKEEMAGRRLLGAATRSGVQLSTLACIESAAVGNFLIGGQSRRWLGGGGGEFSIFLLSRERLVWKEK
jgi:hypothetical protein